MDENPYESPQPDVHRQKDRVELSLTAFDVFALVLVHLLVLGVITAGILGITFR